MRFCATLISALILAGLLAGGQGHATDTQPTEYQIKAAFIYHFAQFVDWPSTVYAQSNSPIVIGIWGENPFGKDLEYMVQGKILNAHPLTVRVFRSLSEVTTNCHILFISSSEKKRVPEIFAALSGASILTVGESEHFIEAGGMIGFVQEGTKVRFQINEGAVKNAGLKMSFKLLSLASHTSH